MIDESMLSKIFEEWDSRYRNNPRGYQTVVEHLLGSTPYSYGVAASRYFTELAKEMGYIN
jgi:hypothetical protein